MLRVLLLSLFVIASISPTTATTTTVVVGAQADALREHPALEDWVQDLSYEGEDDEAHVLIVALKQENKKELERLFWAVSTPSSPEYGQFRTKQEIAELVGAHPSTVKAVSLWLKDGGATSVELYSSNDALRVVMPRRSVNKLFGVTLKRFCHADGRCIYKTLEEVRVPSELAPLIDVLKGVNDFPLYRKRMGLKASGHNQRRVSKSSSSGNAPVVSSAAARGGLFSIEFVPVCLDGNTSSAVPPCSDKGNAVVAVDIKAQTANDVANYTTELTLFIGSSAGGSSTVTCAASGNPLVTSCVISIPASDSRWHLSLWEPVNVGVVSVFSDSSRSSQGYNAFPVAPLPAVTPQTIARQYNIPPHYIVEGANFTQSVVEFEQQYYSPSDLSNFFNVMGLPDTPVTVVGPNIESDPGTEANLDIQYMMGVAPGVNMTFWSIKANSSVEIDDILSWELAVGNLSNPPAVNSLSYGMTSDAVDKFLGAGYLERSDVQFQVLALRGLTIIIACGDTGAGDLGPPPMSEPTCETLHPDWPSQSPYVTAIGSTAITPLAEPICYMPLSKGGIACDSNPLGEIGVSLEQGILFTTGGGFAKRTNTAPYQMDAVANWHSQAEAAGTLPNPGTWNPTGRGYPDAATVGHNLIVSQNGTLIPVDGTSASAPIFGGLVSLLNHVRQQSNQPLLGFVNPLMYELSASLPDAFYDVTVGDNRCGVYGFDPLCCDKAYSAAVGWDPVSGLGSPNFGVIRDYILKQAGSV